MARQHVTRSDPASAETSSSSSPEHSPERMPFGAECLMAIADDDSQSSIGELTNFRNMTVSPVERYSGHRKFSRKSASFGPISRLPPELLMAIFGKLSSPVDLRCCMLVCRQWADCSVELLWHRPYFAEFKKYQAMVKAIQADNSFFSYAQLIKRLNLTFIHGQVSDGSVKPLAVCTRLERLTLTNCSALTDSPLMEILACNPRIQALDLSQLELITDRSLHVVAENCSRLQGLNIAGCKEITDASLVSLSHKCRFLRRLKLNDCNALTNTSVISLAARCPQLLEIDLHKCHNITDESVIQLFTQLRQLRELRLAYCDLLTDEAFLQLPNRTYDHLRILDLTNCELLTDEAVNKIVNVAPRLRNLVLAKCRNITDRAVESITRLGKNLHYLHLGHCSHLTDHAVQSLVKFCNRIRYIDLACCTRLTDASICQFAVLPKLRRIGLVKCNNITDLAIQALVRRMNSQPCPLERVHLSYCMNLTVEGIHDLVNSCQELTHLSLTGVEVFYRRKDLIQFCRPPPKEFNEHQRDVFCVFSGSGVHKLRHYLNDQRAATEPRMDEAVYYVDVDDAQEMEEYGEGGTDENNEY